MGLFFAKQYIASEAVIPVLYNGTTLYLKKSGSKLILDNDLSLEYIVNKIKLTYRDNKHVTVTVKDNIMTFYLFENAEVGEIETLEFVCENKTIHIKNGNKAFEDIFERNIN
jgi:hypothetical protein